MDGAPMTLDEWRKLAEASIRARREECQCVGDHHCYLPLEEFDHAISDTVVLKLLEMIAIYKRAMDEATEFRPHGRYVSTILQEAIDRGVEIERSL